MFVVSLNLQITRYHVTRIHRLNKRRLGKEEVILAVTGQTLYISYKHYLVPVLAQLLHRLRTPLYQHIFPDLKQIQTALLAFDCQQYILQP